MIGEGGVHTVSVCLTEGAVRIVVAYGVGVLRDSLLRFGLLAGTGNFGGLGFTTMHTTVRGTSESTITTRGTFTRHTLTRGLL